MNHLPGHDGPDVRALCLCDLDGQERRSRATQQKHGAFRYLDHLLSTAFRYGCRLLQ